jgi:hypothetical protein
MLFKRITFGSSLFQEPRRPSSLQVKVWCMMITTVDVSRKGVAVYWLILDWLTIQDIEYTIVGSEIDWPCIVNMDEEDAIAIKLKFGV